MIGLHIQFRDMIGITDGKTFLMGILASIDGFATFLAVLWKMIRNEQKVKCFKELVECIDNILAVNELFSVLDLM